MGNRYDYHVVLTAYSEEWVSRYTEFTSLLRTSVGDPGLEIEPIGSRMVPGMAAKPTLDLMVRTSPANRASVEAFLERTGLQRLTLPERSGRVFYRRRSPDGIPDLHVHLADDAEWATSQERAFHGLLGRHPELAAAYSHIKKLLLETSGGDPRRYAAGKDLFIRCVAAILDDPPSAEAPEKGFSDAGRAGRPEPA